MNKLKNKNIILIIIFIVLVLLLIFLTKKDNSNNESTNDLSTQYILLTDINDFFTVEGCVNRYINSLSNKETDNLMKLLDKDYIEKNLINQNNILSKLDSIDGMHSFSAKKIYVEAISKNTNNYYVYGLLKKDTINSNDLGNDYYIIVKIDKEKLLFSITPYDGNIFKEDV